MTFSPNLGRWAEVDPIGYEGGDANLYRYEGNRTTSTLDPSGLCGVNATALTGHTMAYLPPAFVAIAVDYLITIERIKKELGGCKCQLHGPVRNDPANARIQCKNEQPTVWINPNNTKAIDQACGVNDCLIDHEQQHMLQHQVICGNMCKGAANGQFVSFQGDACIAKSECLLIPRTINCLLEKYNQPGQAEDCKDRLCVIITNQAKAYDAAGNPQAYDCKNKGFGDRPAVPQDCRERLRRIGR